MCRYLRKLPRDRAEALLPLYLGELARLFPVFGRLEAVAEAPPAQADDPHEVRRKAHQALRELLHRMARRASIVLFADDVQWGDPESAALLSALVRPPDAPPVLFLAGYRRADGATSPFVRALREMEVERRELPVDPLPPAETRDLVAALLPGATGGQVEAIGRESDGNPLLVHELVQFFRAGASADTLTLDTVLRARAARLPDDPRALLEAVAVAAGPIDPDTAGRAADLPPDRQPGALDALLTGRFVRAVGAGEARRVEAYHDRIREAVAGGLTPDRRTYLHRRLAVVHKAAGDVGPEVLAYHLARAGDPTAAAPYHADAAGQAAAALAFDRAADHYRQAVDGIPAGDLRRKGWLMALSGVLANAGRGREAADAFTAAADLSAGTDTLFCRQRAAEQLVRAGRIDEGTSALRAVLGQLGINPPATPSGLARSIFWMRFLTWVRGYEFRERPAAEVPAEDLLRIDVCRWAAGVVRMADLALGTWFHYRGLRLGLRTGQSAAVAQALAREATIGMPFFGQTPERFERLSRLAQDITARLPDPAVRAETEAVVLLFRATAYFLIGEFRRSLAEVEAAGEALSRCTGVSVAYQLSTVRLWEVTARIFLGDLGPGRALYAAEHQGQLERGNRRGADFLLLTARAYEFALAEDRPAEARAAVRAAIGRLGQGEFTQPQMQAWWAEIDTLLYEGRAEEAWAVCEADWARVNRPVLAAVELAQVLADSARARAAVARAAALGAGDRRTAALLAEAGRRAKRMERLRRVSSGPPSAWLVRAAVAHLQGRSPEALAHLERAEVAFGRVGMALYAAAALRQRGRLLDGEAGGRLVTAADAEMTARGVVNPARYAAMYTPGLSGR